MPTSIPELKSRRVELLPLFWGWTSQAVSKNDGSARWLQRVVRE
jgi:hypothetical protein